MTDSSASAASSAVQPSESITEANYKKALKRLARLEKQNAFLVDELVKSKQCLMQMKLEREVILDRVADSLVLEEYDFDGDDDEDVSDVSEDENIVGSSSTASLLKRKRELIDELAEKAEEEEAFARVLSELSAYQGTTTVEARKKAANSTVSSGGPTTSSSSAKKRSKPATSGSRFNRLSALTQAMRTGIISDDETTVGGGGGGSLLPTNSAGGRNLSDLEEFSGFDEEEGEDDFDDFDDLGREEAELAQLKKARRLNLNTSSASGASSSNATTTLKEESSAVLKVIAVPFDSEGRAILPLSLNMITVHDLGQVVYDRPAYHNKRYILPVGFTTSRSYASVLSPDTNMTYFSTIIDNGPVPLYQVTPEGHPEMVFQSASTTGAWAAVAKAAAGVRGKETAPSVSGPDYFGLANPTVSMLIERLPNADKCETYAPKKYEVSNLVGGKNVKVANVPLKAHNDSKDPNHQSNEKGSDHSINIDTNKYTNNDTDKDTNITNITNIANIDTIDTNKYTNNDTNTDINMDIN